MKRRPTLADEFLSVDDLDWLANDTYDRSYAKTTIEALRVAKRFVIDAEASSAIGRMVKDHPRVIADAMDFAIPPFETCWIEFSYAPFISAATSRMVDPRDRNMRMGFLFRGTAVRAILGMDAHEDTPNDSAPILCPFEYTRNKPWTLEEELGFANSLGLSRAGLDQFMWGQSAFEFLEDRDLEALRALRANHSARIMWKQPKSSPEMLKDFFGEMRNIIAVLLFINRTRSVQRTLEVPHKQVIINRRPGVLLSHTVITLSGDPLPIIERLVPGESIWRRLHDVRGHFCHDRVTRESSCDEHMWEEDVTDRRNLRWRCAACGGQRWWRKEHRRGHEEKGLVTSEYRVTN